MNINKYEVMPLSEVLKYVDDAERLGVSEVARSERGFLTAYKKAGNYRNLSDTWKLKRNGFIARHLTKAKMENENIKDYRNNRRALALIMWAFKP
jgi:hypothetical protein